MEGRQPGAAEVRAAGGVGQGQAGRAAGKWTARLRGGGGRGAAAAGGGGVRRCVHANRAVGSCRSRGRGPTGACGGRARHVTGARGAWLDVAASYESGRAPAHLLRRGAPKRAAQGRGLPLPPTPAARAGRCRPCRAPCGPLQAGNQCREKQQHHGARVVVRAHRLQSTRLNYLDVLYKAHSWTGRICWPA